MKAIRAVGQLRRVRRAHRPAAAGAALLLAALGLPPAARAQQAPDAAAPPAPAPIAAEPAVTSLPEIVVTSTRRAELLSKVPISVSAFSEETLDLRGAKDITDVVKFTPGIKIDENGTNNISIRGISSSAGASTTGIYIDDTPIQVRQLGFNADDALPKTFDLDRVEVLRGPQGTLFGAGAEGGAVRYLMAQPNMSKADLYTRSEVSFTQGGAPSVETGIAGGAPLVDNVLGLRASIWYRHDGGWIDRVNPYDTSEVVAHNTNSTNTLALRVAGKWAVNEDIAITPSMIYQDRVANDVSTYWPVLSNPSGNSYVSGWPLGRKEPDRYFLPALKIESDFGSVSLISNTSYFTRYERSGYDGTTYNLGYYQTLVDPNNTTTGAGNQLTLTNPAYFPFLSGAGLNPNLPASLQAYRADGKVTNQQQTFAQEVRLQSDDSKAALLWTAGLFFSKSIQSSTEEISDPGIADFFQNAFGVPYTSVFTLASSGYTLPAFLLPNGDSYYNFNRTVDTQLALFGEATYAITDKLKATAGLRVSRIGVDFDNFADGPQNFGPTGGGGQEHERPVTPKLSLSYQADRDDLFYATFAKGFRAGGADAPIPYAPCQPDFQALGLSASPTSYQSDSTKSYEIGAKNKIGEHLRLASSLFYINWQNIQQNIYLPTCGFQYTANSGNAVSKGGDIQVEYAPTADWSFDLAVGNTNARFTQTAGLPGSYIAMQGDAVEGAALGAMPPWTVALGAQYDFAALEHKSFVRLDVEYEGHSGTPTPGEDPRTAQYDPYDFTPSANTFVTLRAGTQIDKWSLSAFIDNLFDSHPAKLDSSDPNSTVYAFTPPIVQPSSLVSAYTYRPRTIGLTLIYHM
jgi:outer membrane receptor protein involved in Fe transport